MTLGWKFLNLKGIQGADIANREYHNVTETELNKLFKEVKESAESQATFMLIYLSSHGVHVNGASCIVLPYKSDSEEEKKEEG